MSLDSALEGEWDLTIGEPASRVDHYGMVVDMSSAQVRTLDEVRKVFAQTQELQLRPVAGEKGATHGSSKHSNNLIAGV